LAALPLVLALSGCATSVPELQRVGQTSVDEGVREQTIVDHIKCELRNAVQAALDQEVKDDALHAAEHRPELDYSIDWIKTWGASVSMKILVDEKASVAPSLTETHALQNVIAVFAKGGNVSQSQSSSTALGASLSSDATRTETIGFYLLSV
jgi:hypothetical protein